MCRIRLLLTTQGYHNVRMRGEGQWSSRINTEVDVAKLTALYHQYAALEPVRNSFSPALTSLYSSILKTEALRSYETSVNV
jgi:hypothetical protein